jgi:hypothetical protein
VNPAAVALTGPAAAASAELAAPTLAPTPISVVAVSATRRWVALARVPNRMVILIWLSVVTHSQQDVAGLAQEFGRISGKLPGTR